ncbi:MAG TPA: DUF2062 domain-containing protein [Chryseolinea sp.]
MGIVPIWGFQLAVGIPLAFLFRLNKVLFILAANISIPPMIPLILFLSHLTGSIWMGSNAQFISFSQEVTFDMMKASFIQYVLGALTLACVAAIIFGGIAYIGLRIFRRQKV